MLTRITGRLESVASGLAVLSVGPIAYEVHVPACDAPRLAGRIGEELTLHTLHYLEAQGQGSSLLPRLVGFDSPHDRTFFQLFTTVKGMGYRKSLRALAIPFAEVARAIHHQDHAALQALPEIGKRSAQTIVAELSEKVEPFLPQGVEQAGVPPGATVPTSGPAADAVDALVHLGEPRQRAEALVAKAARDLGEEATADALVTAALR
jgi:Holliday junction DNA helicase RuvA